MSLIIKLLNNDKFQEKEQFTSLIDFEPRYQLLSQVVVSELSNLRSGNAHTKTRGEVRGGGKKPWKQKGTGRARHGSRRSPIWVGGGITHGPRNNRNWHKKINKTSRICAFKSILKERLQTQSVYSISGEFQKTKETKEVIQKILDDSQINKPKKLILVYTTADKEKMLGFRNTEVKSINASQVQIHKLVSSEALILTPGAIELFELKLSNK